MPGHERGHGMAARDKRASGIGGDAGRAADRVGRPLVSGHEHAHLVRPRALRRPVRAGARYGFPRCSPPRSPGAGRRLLQTRSRPLHRWQLKAADPDATTTSGSMPSSSGSPLATTGLPAARYSNSFSGKQLLRVLVFDVRDQADVERGDVRRGARRTSLAPSQTTFGMPRGLVELPGTCGMVPPALRARCYLPATIRRPRRAGRSRPCRAGSFRRTPDRARKLVAAPARALAVGGRQRNGRSRRRCGTRYVRGLSRR